MTAMQYQGDVLQLGDTRQLQGKLELLLRVAVAAEFIGHGAFGVIGKEGWLPYFDVLGIGESAAWHLMPMQGCIDITLGIVLLVSPMRGPLAFMAAWGLFTAALRPLAGEGIWKLVERSYNYGIPLLLLLLYRSGIAVELAPNISLVHADQGSTEPLSRTRSPLHVGPAHSNLLVSDWSWRPGVFTNKAASTQGIRFPRSNLTCFRSVHTQYGGRLVRDCPWRAGIRISCHRVVAVRPRVEARHRGVALPGGRDGCWLRGHRASECVRRPTSADHP